MKHALSHTTLKRIPFSTLEWFYNDWVHSIISLLSKRFLVRKFGSVFFSPNERVSQTWVGWSRHWVDKKKKAALYGCWSWMPYGCFYADQNFITFPSGLVWSFVRLLLWVQISVSMLLCFQQCARANIMNALFSIDFSCSAVIVLRENKTCISYDWDNRSAIVKKLMNSLCILTGDRSWMRAFALQMCMPLKYFCLCFNNAPWLLSLYFAFVS